MKKLGINEMKDVNAAASINYMGCVGDYCCKQATVAGETVRQCGSLEWYLS